MYFFKILLLTRRINPVLTTWPKLLRPMAKKNCSLSESDTKYHIPNWFIFLQIVPMETLNAIGQPAEGFLTSFQFLSNDCPKLIRKNFLSERIIFFKIFLWTGRIQFYQTRRKLFEKRQNFFSPLSEIDNKKKQIFPKEEFIDQCPKKIKKTIFYKLYHVHRKFLLTGWKQSWQTKCFCFFLKLIRKNFFWRN